MPSRRALLLASAATAVVVAAGGTAVGVRLHGQDAARDDAARAAATALAAAWSAGDPSTARFAGTGAAQVKSSYAALTGHLGGARPHVEVTGVDRSGDTATARLAVTWPVGGGWRYATTARLAPAGGASTGPWGARWSAQVVHPRLAPGQHLVLQRAQPPRAPVLGRDGSALVADGPVVQVGVQPSRTTDPDALARALAGVVGVDPAALARSIRAAAPSAVVPVITLRQSDYDAVRARLEPLAGTVFQRAVLPLAPTPGFARALLGRVGPATADAVSASGGRVAAGDTTGLWGLQAQYDQRLSGTAGTTVLAVPDSASAPAATTLFTAAAAPGRALRLTLDARVQEAAEAALATARSGDAVPSAALVAVDVPSGDVLAVANTPSSGSDRALVGHYPPGSTFKTATTAALLATGLTPDTPVTCTPSATVEGRTFRNFEGEAFGDVPFRTDFAQSCNTAFIALSSRLRAGDLRTAAASLGVGGTWSVGTPAFTGSVPADQDALGRAAASIGQGTVLASPLAMAVAAATIARGSWVAPRLVADPAPPAASGAAPSPDGARMAVVRDLMRSVVTSGTASALAGVPGAPVSAKTGTAEYGSANPPHVHAWTVGFQGSTAFAVLVENGTSGAVTAVPVAGAFLRALAG